jgi:hypothetical protein
MDANLSEETMNIIQELRFVNKDVKQDTYKYYNTYKPKQDYSVEFVECPDETVSRIYADLSAGKKIAVAITQSKKAKKLYMYCKKEFPNKVIKVYSKELGEKKDFLDVKINFSGVDLLIYTPTLTAGVSFEEKHYDVMYGIFGARSCNAETCL